MEENNSSQKSISIHLGCCTGLEQHGLMVVQKAPDDIIVHLNGKENDESPGVTPLPDEFVEELDRRITCKDTHHTKTIIEMAEHVDLLIHSLVKGLKELNKKWDFQAIKTGSSSEDVQVGIPREYDFMLEFKTFTDERNMEHLQYLPDQDDPKDISNCKMNLKTDLTDWKVDEIKDETWTELSTAYYKFSYDYRETGRNRIISGIDEYMTLNDGITKVLQTLKETEAMRLFELKTISKNDDKPNCFLRLVFNGDIYMDVMIDLVPCIKFNPKEAKTFWKYNKKALAFLGKECLDCNTEEAVTYINQNLKVVQQGSRWRISTSMLEKLIMQVLPPAVKTAYRVSKFLFRLQGVRAFNRLDPLEAIERKTIFESYKLKLVFLHLVMNIYGSDLEQNYFSSSALMLQAICSTWKQIFQQVKDWTVPKIDHFLLSSKTCLLSEMIIIHVSQIREVQKRIQDTLSLLLSERHVVSSLELRNIIPFIESPYNYNDVFEAPFQENIKNRTNKTETDSSERVRVYSRTNYDCT